MYTLHPTFTYAAPPHGNSGDPMHHMRVQGRRTSRIEGKFYPNVVLHAEAWHTGFTDIWSPGAYSKRLLYLEA